MPAMIGEPSVTSTEGGHKTPPTVARLAPPLSLGEIVLLKLDTYVERPFLIASMLADETITGWLFCDGPVDASSIWLREQGQGVPSRHSGPIYLDGLKPGTRVGTYRRRLR